MIEAKVRWDATDGLLAAESGCISTKGWPTQSLLADQAIADDRGAKDDGIRISFES